MADRRSVAPLELGRGAVELLPPKEDHAEVVVRRTVVQVGGESLPEQPFGLGAVRRVEDRADPLRDRLALLELDGMTMDVADAIVDLVSTGSTLKANQLVEVEHIMDISSRLVVNQASLKLKTKAIRHLIETFDAAISARAKA